MSVALAPSQSQNADLFRTFGILAAVAFVTGFMGYLAFVQTDLATLQAQMTAPAGVSRATAPAPAADDWNQPKSI